jgi:plasmid stabilization system protein ParE
MNETNRKVFRSPDAQEDLLSIWHFGAEKWSPEQADRHMRDIQWACGFGEQRAASFAFE